MSARPTIAAILAASAALVLPQIAAAEWKPVKPIEFIATAGPGGGTDNLARTIQSIITKHKLIDQPVVVVNKPGGSGAEGYIYGKSQAGDPYKVIFGTSNAWSQPMVSKLAYKHTDLTPIAAMAQDEFLLWVKQDSPIKTAKDYVEAGKKTEFKMGGAQSKDTDELLTRMIAKEAGNQDHLYPLQERRRGRGPARRRPYRLEHQQSEREHRAVEGLRPSGRSASSARSACRPVPRSPRPKAGTTSRPASSRASTSRSSSSPAPSGCPAR